MQQAAPALAALPAGGMIAPAAMMSAGIIPASLMQSMLQNMQAGMPGKPAAVLGCSISCSSPSKLRLPPGMSHSPCPFLGMQAWQAWRLWAAWACPKVGTAQGSRRS